MGSVQGGALSDLLRIAGLTVRYGDVTALDALDLNVRQGELFVLLGGSGSGKTTLLRAIAGFVRPAGGEIRLNGADMARLPPHRRPVNTMFQSYALFPHMTVAENIAFGPRQAGASRAEAAERVSQMLSLVRLRGLGDRRPHELSGGQQQRVALARSLAARPRLLLLDEPLSALDRGLRAETRAELMRLNRELDTSFILVTHDQDEALTMADRIGVMRDGRMAQIDAPEVLYERPDSRFVASFMGVANILPAVIAADGVTADLANVAVTVRATVGATPGAGWIGIRSERIRIDDDAPSNRLPARLTGRTYTGEAVIWSAELTDGSVMRVAEPVGGPARAMGSLVALSWQPDATILLSR